MDTIKLPLENSDILEILPHRFPFLFVDRIIELEPGARIVGLKRVTNNDPYLSSDGTLPPSILTEVMAQVGAILLLVKPEMRHVLPLFAGINQLRVQATAQAGDEVHVEVETVRLRQKTAVFKGTASVDGRVIMRGRMTCALMPRAAAETSEAPATFA